MILAEGEEYDPRPPLRFPVAVGASTTSYYHRRAHHQERSLAALAGATVTTTGPDAFSVSVEVAAADQGVDDHACSSALDTLANPEMLPLWCSALDASHGHRLVVVRRSEENATTTTTNNDSRRRGAYDGEWVEATAPLALPLSSGWHVLRWTTALGRLLGCGCSPYSGRIKIFVERPARRVSLTLGPFPGNVHVCHRLQVVVVEDDDDSNNGIVGRTTRIQDSVRLQRGSDEEEEDSCGCLSSCAPMLEHCFLPTVQDYMDQTLSSLARLRFLLERRRRGEQQQQRQSSVYASAATSPNESDYEMQSPLLMTTAGSLS